MDENKPEARFDQEATGPWDLAAYALKEHRVALVDSFNRVMGAPSVAMAIFQEEFTEERMDPAETLAFAKVCYGVLAGRLR